MHRCTDPEPTSDIGIFGLVAEPEHGNPRPQKPTSQRQQVERCLRHSPLFALGAKLVEAVVDKGDDTQRQQPRRVEGQGRVLKDPKPQRCHENEKDEVNNGLHRQAKISWRGSRMPIV